MSRETRIAAMEEDISEAIKHNSTVNLITGGYIRINTEGMARELYDDGYRKKTEVAAEIFDDLEKWIAVYHEFRITTEEKFAELKKKFTEGWE